MDSRIFVRKERVEQHFLQNTLIVGHGAGYVQYVLVRSPSLLYIVHDFNKMYHSFTKLEYVHIHSPIRTQI